MNKSTIAAIVFCCMLMSNTVHAQDKLYANEFALSDVTLLAGPFKHAQELNIEVLLKYDVDRLLAPYRKEAGLSEKATAYPNWDGLDGHVGGHYLSALAINYHATGNRECKRRMEYMLTEIELCQQTHAVNHPEWGIGYAGGVPNSSKLWSTFKNGNFETYNRAWAAFYNLHKTYAGLRDAWLYGGSEVAKKLFLQFCDWGISIAASLSEEQMQSVLNVEHGGMNEIFADAYQMSGDIKYLVAAKKYSHRQLLDPFSNGVDNLDNKHANTQIPKFIGFERIGTLSNDDKYTKAGSFFWETVTGKRSLASGGNSRREHFPTVASSIDYVNEIDGPESCNSYNMLKLTEELFRENPQAKYADYYERTIFNHILSTQHPVHGGYVYFTPARPRHYRVYSAPGEAMWCCVGSGMENHGKYNQFIYTHQNNALYINLFIPSVLKWKEKNITLQQETNFPFEEETKITITEGSGKANLMIRYPAWVADGQCKVLVNGKPIPVNTHPSSYISIDKKWNKGDVIQVKLPMHHTTVQMPNVPQYIAFMHGPILLGAKTGSEDLKGIIADDSRFGQYADGKKLPVDKAPILIEDNLQNIESKLVPVKGKPLHYTLNVKMINGQPLMLEPFFQIHDSRYMMYWLSLTNNGYQSYLDSLTQIENEKAKIEKRTVDHVAPGEQQPETDHKMLRDKSATGNTNDIFFRDARNGGFFSYEMKTAKETELILSVKYWGAEWGSRKFEIYIDDQKLITEDNTGRWNLAAFKDVYYTIPKSMLEGKSTVVVKFQSLETTTAGAVYALRLLKKENENIMD